ncbi:MAG: hybrid sensor histidine kinase/response regulator [Anaerolineae bacterium]|nr:hybrid sensor histidine kinase/response regulator [Anaerolineae bacterium]
MMEKSVRVLIAEDDVLVAKMIYGLLTERGFEIAGEAGTGKDALAMTQSLKPDVVLMDIAMPDMDGLEASTRIQNLCPTPVIALTAYENVKLVERAADSGVVAYLVKPVSGRQLERAILIARARFGDLMQVRYLNQQLQLINEDLERFSYTVAHDLRHLLSPIMGYAEVLYEEFYKIPAEEARDDLLTILQVARDMNNLIDELMTLARARQEVVDLLPLDMQQIVGDVLRRLEYSIKNRGAQIIVAENWPVVYGHAPWVIEIWINYLSNAIKHGGATPVIELGWADAVTDTEVYWSPTDSNNTASITGQKKSGAKNGVTPDSRCVVFWVRDYGFGIADQKLPYIFNAFSRLPETKLRGHGLGLSIVKRITERLGGRVGVKSEPDHGSTFYFTLPLFA